MSEKIGHYTIVSRIGRGGMGVVYKAHEESLNRYVAIKVLGEHLIEDEQFLARFIREAQSAAGLSHPNIVQIHFIGQDEGRHYFVMEYVSGKPIDAIIREHGRLDSIPAAQIILQASQGLAAAHDKGIIHRDIKPANLILDERGIVKIADFGLALPSQIQSRLTATGMLMGTPGYMAPEQCRGEQADNRTDLYALGITLYEMLTGNVPFKAESPLILLKQILEEPAPDVSSINPDVDREIVEVLDRMIAKEREDRFQSAHELVDALESYLSGRGVRTMTRGLAVLAAGAAAAGSADPTMPLGGGTAPPTGPTVPDASRGAQDATIVDPPPAGRTAPDLISSSAQTEPDAPVVIPPPPPPVPGSTPEPVSAVPAQRQGKRSSTLLILALVLFLCLVLAGGAFAAWKMIGGFFGEDGNEVALQEMMANDEEMPASVAETSMELSAPVRTTTTSLDQPELEAGPDAMAQTSAPAGEAKIPEQAAVTSARAAEPVPSASQSPSRPRPQADPVPVASPALRGAAIVVTGDSGLADHVASGLLSRFRGARVDAVDARFLPETESMVLGDPSVEALTGALRRAGVRWMVLARIEPAGERQLSYMGRSETAYRSRINISTIDVVTGRPVGQTHSESIEYTSLNAERQAETALRRIGREIAESIRERNR